MKSDRKGVETYVSANLVHQLKASKFTERRCEYGLEPTQPPRPSTSTTPDGGEGLFGGRSDTDKGFPNGTSLGDPGKGWLLRKKGGELLINIEWGVNMYQDRGG